MVPVESMPVSEGTDNMLLGPQSVIPMQENLAPSSSTDETRVLGRKGKSVAPLSTTPCRSTRQNKYDGFCVNLNQDSRPSKSKVKPRVTPSVVPDITSSSDIYTAEIPTPTDVSTMHHIGVLLCAVGAEALTEEALNGTVAKPASPTT